MSAVAVHLADTKQQLWKTSLTIGRVVESADIPTVPSRPGGPCTDIAPYYGITSTPVIDPETSTVYVMSYSVEGPDTFTAQYRCSTCPLSHVPDSDTVHLQSSQCGTPGGGLGIPTLNCARMAM